jgi:hypothetical protein
MSQYCYHVLIVFGYRSWASIGNQIYWTLRIMNLSIYLSSNEEGIYLQPIDKKTGYKKLCFHKKGIYKASVNLQ